MNLTILKHVAYKLCTHENKVGESAKLGTFDHLQLYFFLCSQINIKDQKKMCKIINVHEFAYLCLLLVGSMSWQTGKIALIFILNGKRNQI